MRHLNANANLIMNWRWGGGEVGGGVGGSAMRDIV
jgi:hypothetical protein